MRPAMTSYLRRSAEAFLLLSGVAGAIASIALVGHWWGYLIGGLIAAALVVGSAPYAQGLATRVLEYPALRQRETEMEARRALLEGEVVRLTDETTLRYDEGLEEGRRQVAGAITALM